MLTTAKGRLRPDSRKVKILLIEKGLRAADLARAWRVSEAAVSRAINGKRPCSLLLGKLAGLLGVALKDILVTGERKRAA